jgi:16S rRNA (adenine1518-N6/adenine1519-N6)-dimethyltransferase
MGTLKPKKRLGQHFLINQGAVEAICEAALASDAQAIVEIGPGRGALTGHLLKDRRPLSAIELDADACSFLTKAYSAMPNFSLHHGDAAAFELPASKKVCIVGNLPYNAATAILTRILTGPIPWERMVLMFQLEVGQKLIGRPSSKAYGPLSVLAQVVADIRTLLKLGPGSFKPQPKVDSIVLQFEPKHDAPSHGERRELLSILHKSFSRRRKTIANNWQLFYDETIINEVCTKAGVSPLIRAEAIAPEKWVEIARLLADCG